ncbi:UNVERIFIED_ORG: hypothetical protein OKW25_004755 [Pseudomonas vranovensis]|nr:hypothetical protein [Pseudomonas vranovensis]
MPNDCVEQLARSPQASRLEREEPSFKQAAMLLMAEHRMALAELGQLKLSP